MDGTLTESKRPLTRVQAAAFSRFAEKYKTAVISGASFSQMREQFVSRFPGGKTLPDFLVLALNGGEMWKLDERQKRKDKRQKTKDKRIWKRAYQKPFSAALKKKTRGAVKEMERKFAGILPQKVWGALVDDRGGQITYSVLGARAPIARKHKWDPRGLKRLKMAKHLKTLLPGCDIGVAGMTSIDITPKGLTKEFGVRKAMRAAGARPAETVFVGDAVFKGGNDAPARRAGVKVVKVKNPRETYKWMKRFAG